MQPTFATSQFQEQACSFESAGETIKAIVTRPPQGTPVRGGIVLSHGWSGFRSGPSGILTAFAREFAALGEVEYAEPNYLVYSLGTPAEYTSDPFYSQQWGIPAVGLDKL